MKPLKNAKYYIFAFLSSIIFFSFVLAVSGVYPFGSSSIIHGDLNNQYLALFSYLRENLLSGNFDRLFYSTSMNLGSGFFGVVTYYIMNPLNLMVVFFKTSQLPIFIEILTILKIGLAGTSVYYFFQHSTFLSSENDKNIRKIVGIFMSILYANMLFVFNYKECLMWLDGVVMLPLVVLGVEYIVVVKRIKLYVLTLTLTVLLNYYIGVIVGVGAVFAYILISAITWENSDLKYKLNAIKQFIISSLLVILLTACILIPSLLSTSGIIQNHSFEFKPIYNPIYLFSAFFNGIIVGDVPAVFIGGIPIFLCALFFLQKSIPIRIRVTIFIAYIMLFISTCLDVTYLIWHVFTWPNGFPQRESFILSFFIVVLAYYTFVHVLTINSNDTVRRNIILWLAFSVVLFAMHFMIGFRSLQAVGYFFGIGLFVFALRFKKSKFRCLFWCLIFMFMGVDVLIADVNVQKSQNIGSSDYREYVRYYDSVAKAVQNVSRKKLGFYRIGNLFQITNNDPILFNYNGVSNYLSQQSSQLTSFMSNMGYYQNHTYDRWTNYNSGSTKSMDSFLGIRYVIGNSNNKFADRILKINDITSGVQTKGINNYDTEKKIGDFQIYSIKNVFPLIFKTGSNIQTSTSSNPFIVQNKLFNSVGGKKQRSIFVYQNVIRWHHEEFKINVSNTGEVYAYFPTEKNKDYNDCDIYVNGNKVSEMFSGPGENGQSENGIVALGKYSRGTVLRVKVKTHNQVPGRYNVSQKPFVAVENQSNFVELLHRVKQESKISHVNTKQNVNLSFNTDNDFKGGNMIVTLPVEKGWHAQIDSKKVKVNSSLNALMSIKVPSGHHTVRLVYHTPGLFLGCIISLITLLLISMTTLYNKLFKKWRKL